MNFCKDCKYHLESLYGDKCKFHIHHTNSISGKKIYEDCIYINNDGKCKNWEPNFLYIFLGKIKELFNFKK